MSSGDKLIAVVVVCITIYNMWSLWLEHRRKGKRP